MSDGNFNRSMLPYNSYQSGFRAGHARMKHQALEALIATLEEELENPLSTAEKEIIIRKFQCRLSIFTP